VNGEQVLFEFAESLAEKGKLSTATAKQLDRLMSTYRNITEEELRTLINSLEPDLRREYKKAYYQFVNGGYKKTHPGIQGYKIADLKPAYRKEVQNSVDNSLALIKTQNAEFMAQMEARFRNWATIPSAEMRGDSANPDKIKAYLKNEVLKLPEVKKEMTGHQHFIIVDQTRKLLSNMDAITAKQGGAIAFIWHNRRDGRVVGRPGGVYPEPTEKHGDHWEREGKLYLISDSWAISRKMLKKTKEVGYDTDLKDGRPGIPIGCRCWAEYIYAIELIPEKYRDCITEKGMEYMK
jgi:hypothetical protein